MPQPQSGVGDLLTSFLESHGLKCMLDTEGAGSNNSEQTSARVRTGSQYC